MYYVAPLKAPVITALVLTATTALIAQAAPAHFGDPAIANEYVRVWKFALPTGSSILVPDNGRVHILIGQVPTLAEGTVATLTDSSDVTHSRSLELRSPGVWLLDSAQHQIANPNRVAVIGLLLELQTDPGRVSCSESKSCPWSIRWQDPVPVLLSEHVTIFHIYAPWKPEPRSLIVPTSDVFIDGKKQSAWEPVWMPSPLEITSSPGSSPGVFLGGSPFLEVAFFDQPFCGCKRVRK